MSVRSRALISVAPLLRPRPARRRRRSRVSRRASAQHAGQAPDGGQHSDGDHGGRTPDQGPLAVTGRADERHHVAHDHGQRRGQDHPGEELVTQEELSVVLCQRQHCEPAHAMLRSPVGTWPSVPEDGVPRRVMIWPPLSPSGDEQ
ncbi:MAG: hypothetical protein MZU95_07395 [Desulfomicrobium escambiense]|nr:hypothetical protein [Desulfomicrobium escambiense]